MIEDMDSLYTNIESVARSTQGVTPKPDSRYVKYFKYTAHLSGDVQITEDNKNSSVSQYQESIIRLTLDSSFYSAQQTAVYDGYTVLMYVSGPEDPEVPNSGSTASDDLYQRKFANIVHLRPVAGAKGVFEFHLNELLGNQMHIGDKNEVKFVFMITAHNITSDSYDRKYMRLLTAGSPIVIEMYKTNAKYSNEVDDMTNAFIAIAELKELIQ